MNLEKRIDFVCETLIPNWRITLEMERGAATVTLFRPDGSEVAIDQDGDETLNDLIEAARGLAFDEWHRELKKYNNPAQPRRDSATQNHEK